MIKIQETLAAVCLIVLFTIVIAGYAQSQQLYQYKIIRVIDGDTIEFEAPFLPKELKQTLRLRVNGVDTPEKGPLAKCGEEMQKSITAKQFTEQQIQNAKTTSIVLVKWDKYGGRVLGDVVIDGVRLSKLLIDNNYAIPYNGGKKQSWCPRK